MPAKMCLFLTSFRSSRGNWPHSSLVRAFSILFCWGLKSNDRALLLFFKFDDSPSKTVRARLTHAKRFLFRQLKRHHIQSPPHYFKTNAWLIPIEAITSSVSWLTCQLRTKYQWAPYSSMNHLLFINYGRLVKSADLVSIPSHFSGQGT